MPNCGLSITVFCFVEQNPMPPMSLSTDMSAFKRFDIEELAILTYSLGRKAFWAFPLKRRLALTSHTQHEADDFHPILQTGVTKRCRLSWWPIAPSYTSPNAGGGGELWDVSQWVQQCTWSQNKLCRSNTIFNLGYRHKATKTCSLKLNDLLTSNKTEQAGHNRHATSELTKN